MARSVTLQNGKAWGTQTAALQHFKAILARYKDGDVISGSEDQDDLLALLLRYDMQNVSEQSKLGGGIERFERRLNRGEGYSSSGFWAVRADGTETDFSYISAVRGSPKPVAQQYYDACRNSVNAALSSTKQEYFDRCADENGCLLCDISGRKIKYEQARLRHAHPAFAVLIEGFRQMRKWKWDQIHHMLSVPGDAQISTTFVDKRDGEAFRAYHHERAILHIVSKKALEGQSRNVDLEVKRPIRLRMARGR